YKRGWHWEGSTRVAFATVQSCRSSDESWSVELKLRQNFPEVNSPEIFRGPQAPQHPAGRGPANPVNPRNPCLLDSWAELLLGRFSSSLRKVTSFWTAACTRCLPRSGA